MSVPLRALVRSRNTVRTTSTIIRSSSTIAQNTERTQTIDRRGNVLNLSAGSYVGRRIVQPAVRIAGQRRSHATVSSSPIRHGKIVTVRQTHIYTYTCLDDTYGPMQEYDNRVATGRLRDDSHQRGKNTLFDRLLQQSNKVQVSFRVFKHFMTNSKTIRHHLLFIPVLTH